MNAEVKEFSRSGRVPSHEAAEVLSVEARWFTVRTQSGMHRARRSFDCLVVPRLGDTVLIAHLDAGNWILNVLERHAEDDMSLEVEGNLTLVSKQGAVRLVGQHVQHHAEKRLDLSAASYQLHAESSRQVSKTVSVVSNKAQLSTRQVDVSAENALVRLGNLMQRVKNSVRQVQETESVTCGQLLQTVRRCFKSHAKQSLITSETDIKIDAKRIHMG